MSSRQKLCLLGFLALAIVGMAAFILWVESKPPGFESPSNSSGTNQTAVAARLARFEAAERKIDETVWSKELLAESCGRTFETLWDSLNATTNKLNIAASFAFGKILIGTSLTSQNYPHGIQVWEPAGSSRTLSQTEWRDYITEMVQAGWALVQTEFRHIRFDTDANGRPQRSAFYFRADLTNERLHVRATLDGDLALDWDPQSPGAGPFAITGIDASRLTVKIRSGDPPFQLVLSENIEPQKKSTYIDPLILYDLDGDGLSEILLVASNRAYRRNAAGFYEAFTLCQHPLDAIFTAVVADFDGDGHADLLCANADGLFLFAGSSSGAFDQRPRQVWTAVPRWVNPMALTCGDIDGDGHLDVFMGQYKVPTIGQILRPNFYDANDGRPAYLLLNDGHGGFTDITTAAGLAKKRTRRIYSASLVDLDGDGKLDLALVSDFAGIDLFHNDGHGSFTDVTAEQIPESHAFGMGHAVADFNDDGRLDFLMIGMNSATVDRLDHLRLGRPDAPADRAMRSKMTYGNRLYLGRPAGGFEQTTLSDSIARSGWSWGCAAFDFDNDGFPDVYIANGHQSKQTVRDYDPEFWLHDIYVDQSVDDVTATSYFLGKFARTRGQGWSYGGYEKNRLFVNDRGQRFIDFGYLTGVAMEQDSRNVVADDLDGDGRVDLLVTTVEVWPEVRQTLRVYRNELDDPGEWIGFRFLEEPGHVSPVGATITIHWGDHVAVRQIVTGDSHRSQHSNTIHFGLGRAKHVSRAEIRWPGGQSETLNEPTVHTYHWITAPK